MHFTNVGVGILLNLSIRVYSTMKSIEAFVNIVVLIVLIDISQCRLLNKVLTFVFSNLIV